MANGVVIADPYVIRQRYSDAHEGLCRLVREHEVMRAALWSALHNLEIGVECDAVGNIIADAGHVEIVQRDGGGLLVRRARVTTHQK